MPTALVTSSEDPAGALAEVLRAAAWMGSGAAPARTAAAERPAVAGEHRAEDVAPASSAQALERDAGPVEGSEEEEPLTLAEPALSAAVAAPASPVPAGPAAGPQVRLEGEELHVAIDDRRWRVRGLARVTSFEVLRVNVLVARA